MHFNSIPLSFFFSSSFFFFYINFEGVGFSTIFEIFSHKTIYLFKITLYYYETEVSFSNIFICYWYKFNFGFVVFFLFPAYYYWSTLINYFVNFTSSKLFFFMVKFMNILKKSIFKFSMTNSDIYFGIRTNLESSMSYSFINSSYLSMVMDVFVVKF